MLDIVQGGGLPDRIAAHCGRGHMAAPRHEARFAGQLRERRHPGYAPPSAEHGFAPCGGIDKNRSVLLLVSFFCGAWIHDSTLLLGSQPWIAYIVMNVGSHVGFLFLKKIKEQYTRSILSVDALGGGLFRGTADVVVCGRAGR